MFFFAAPHPRDLNLRICIDGRSARHFSIRELS
jgi:hypothetical protein